MFPFGIFSLAIGGFLTNVPAQEQMGSVMQVTDPKTMGNAVRNVRRALGVSQEQLALTSGTNRRFIVELEAGKATAQLGKVLQVLRTLGITLQLLPPVSPTPEGKEQTGAQRA